MLGGVNHCHSHCRLVKFRDLMYGGKYTSVIGWKIPINCVINLGSHKSAYFPANHRRVFPHVHQITEFRQTTVHSANSSGCPLPVLAGVSRRRGTKGREAHRNHSQCAASHRPCPASPAPARGVHPLCCTGGGDKVASRLGR